MSLRFSVFVGVFVVMAILEHLRPRRVLIFPRSQRWPTNLTIVGLSSLLVRAMAAAPWWSGAIVMPLVAVAMADQAEKFGWGLFNLTTWPVWLELVLSLIVLDFAIWLQHWASHKIRFLWRFHRMHHADRDIDVTTALRFHPVEIMASMLYKMVWVVVLGPSALAVILFETILNGCALFNHANLHLPLWFDRMLRTIVVTPDMHRVHHSTIAHEHHTNFGFNLSIWDRIFCTYVADPAAGHEKMQIGLPEYQSLGPNGLSYSLMIPFRDG